MPEHEEPTLSDEEVNVLVDFLKQRETIGDRVIEIIVQAIISLQKDRAVLIQTMKELMEKEDV